jgi:alpha-mannosidase
MLLDYPTNAPLRVNRHTGPVTEVLEVFEIFRLPQSLTQDRTSRQPFTSQFVPVSVNTIVRLTRGVPRVDIDVHITNDARDHRFRAHFPTGITVQEAFFDGQFEVVNRSILLPDSVLTTRWAEQPVPEQPQNCFTTVLGDESGLTIGNRGLPEVAVLASPSGGTEIALTLLRCVGWTDRRDLDTRAVSENTPLEVHDAQCRGSYAFSFCLIPHDSDPLPAWHEAWAFQTPLEGVLTSRHPGVLPFSGSLIKSSNASFVISAVKLAEDGNGLIVRGYNVSGYEQRVILRPGWQFSDYEFVHLDERGTGSFRKVRKNGSCVFEVKPYRIVTIRLFSA